MSGRFGRSPGRGYPTTSKPRYLSQAPPIPRYPPFNPLKDNHYEELANQHLPRLHSIKIDQYNIIKTYSRSADEFLQSLSGSSDASSNYIDQLDSITLTKLPLD